MSLGIPIIILCRMFQEDMSTKSSSPLKAGAGPRSVVDVDKTCSMPCMQIVVHINKFRSPVADLEISNPLFSVYDVGKNKSPP